MRKVKINILNSVNLCDSAFYHGVDTRITKKVSALTWEEIEKEMGLYMVFTGEPVDWMCEMRGVE